MSADQANQETVSSAPRLRMFWPAATAIILVACVLRFSALDMGLPNRLVRPDEDDVLRVTLLPARGEFDLGWSIYPSAYVYLTWAWNEAGLGLGSALGGAPRSDYAETLRREPARLFLIARSMSAVSGVAAVLLLMLLARRCLGDVPALAAGTLLATSFLHARDSHAVKPDALLALAVVTSLLAMLPLARRATPRAGALAGLGVGAAMAAKYPGVVLLLPVYISCVLQSEARNWRRLVPTPAIVAVAVAAALFVATSPFLVLNRESVDGMIRTVFLVFPELLPGQGGEAAPTMQIQDPAPPAAGPYSNWWGGFLYHLRFSLWYGAGKLATLLAPAALVWGLLCRRPMTVIASSFVLAYFLLMGLSPTLLSRYMTPMLPALFLLEAGLLEAAAKRWTGTHWRASVAVLVLIVSAEPLAGALSHNRVVSEVDTRLHATRWLRAHVPRSARVAMHGTRFYPYGAPEIPAKLRYVVSEPEPDALAAARVQYLVTHDHELFFSSVDPSVMSRLAPRLTLEAEFPAYDPDRADPTFEQADAYYVPIHGFSGVDRAGPHIKIFRFR